MKTALFGNQLLIQKLTDSLSESGVEMIAFTELTEAISGVENERFDLVLVDSSAEKAEVLCQHINNSCALPVVLIVDGKQPEWRRLQSLDAHGYITVKASNGELVARLKAILRHPCRAQADASHPGGISIQT
jgi:DNA-binding response OmpR family regulator